MKINFFDKGILNDFLKIFVIENLVVTTILIFFDIPKNETLLYFIIFIILNLIIYAIILKHANRLTNVSLTINNSNFKIKTGNIFEEPGLKVINFNEYFDTCVDNKVIAKNSLNGKFIETYVPNIGNLDKIINESLIPYEINKTRKNAKKKKYKLGSIVEYNDFLLVALTKFNSENMATLSLREYVEFLMSFWNNLNVVFANRDVNITLFGSSGLTRFDDANYMSEQELLEIIIWTFKISRIKFKYPTKITLVVPKQIINKLNLYKIKELF